MTINKTADDFRRYDLDWLRAIAILILLFFHVGMLFNSWGWHIKNSETSTFFEPIMMILHQWRMPLLLFISGAGTVFALRKKTLKQYIGERNLRLMVPLVFGMFVIVPPQIYFEKITQYQSYLDFYPEVFKMVPYPMGGAFSWHHLWFILYLFVYSIVCLPILHFLKSEKSLNFKLKAEKWLERHNGGFWILVTLLLSQALLRPYYPHATHALVEDYAYLVYYGLYFLAGVFVCSIPGFWNQLLTQKKINGGIALFSTSILLMMYTMRKIGVEIPIPHYVIIWKMVEIILALYWVLAIVGYGQKYLNHRSSLLTKVNEGIYPFYILHQTAIIMFGYYIIQWDLSIPSKYILVSLTSLFGSIFFYLIFIRPFNLVRLLFGMRMKPVQKKRVEILKTQF